MILDMVTIKRLCFSIIAVSLIFEVGIAQSPDRVTRDYTIEIRWDDISDPNQMVILGHHFGDKQFTVDTTYVNENGVSIFEGDSLRHGIYLIYIPGLRYFDFLVAESDIKLQTSINDPVGDMRVISSSENELFFGYLKYLDEQRKKAQDINNRIQEAEQGETESLQDQLVDLDMEVNNYLDDFLSGNSESLTAKIVGLNRQINVPDPPTDADGKVVDETFQYFYYYNNYWNYTELTEEALLYSPSFEPKLKRFMIDLTVQHPDSIIKSAEIVVEKTKGNREMFRYVVNWITNYYETSNLMSSESVFVHMVNKYYSEDQAWWVDPNALYRIRDRAKVLEPLLIGKEIQNLVIKDIDGEYQNLHQSSANYTVLFFYDKDSGFSKTAVPIIEETREKYADEGLEVWGIAVDLENNSSDVTAWRNFIRDNDINEWTNVADLENRLPIKYTYDVRSTPTIIVIDKNKEITLRRIGAEQLGKIMEDLIEDDR